MPFYVPVGTLNMQPLFDCEDCGYNIEVIVGRAGWRLKRNSVSSPFQIVASNRNVSTGDLEESACYINEYDRA
jgi:hypothetical protein